MKRETDSGFYVSGTTIYDATGAAFMLRGVSHEHTWFKSDLEKAIPAVAATGTNTIRIVLSDGSVWTRDDTDSVRRIISLCRQYKMITILEVHDATGKDDITSLNSAVNYWISLSDLLKGTESHVIINIANEWYSQNNSTSWAAGYQSAIPALRTAGLSHLLIVDCAGWGQYPNTIAEQGLTVFNADTLHNTVFSIHMYENAGRDAETIKNNIDNALAINVPVIVGEFGHSHDDQIVDADTIMSYCRQKSVGWLAWSWYGNNSSYLDLATGPDGALTTWGERVVNATDGIRETSVPCGVFG
jgi:mannan endo-1,4-beta-mannosidase